MTQVNPDMILNSNREDPFSFYNSVIRSDEFPMYGPVTIGENISISVITGSKEEANELFEALSAGGRITQPLGTTFWGAYFGMLIDKFGIIWMVNSEV